MDPKDTEQLAREIVEQSIESAMEHIKRANIPEKPNVSNVGDIKEPLPPGRAECDICPSRPLSDVTTEPEPVTTTGPQSEQNTTSLRTTEPTSEPNTVAEPTTEPESEWKDILGSGALMKRIIVAGDASSKHPYMYDHVLTDVKTFLETGQQIEQLTDLSYVIGDGDVTQALEMCVRHMHVGEVAEVKTASRFAYGDKGREPNIPAGASLLYRVKLKSKSGPPDYGAMTVQQRIQHADNKRERGNWFYSRQEFTQAINSYQRSLAVLDESSTRSDEPPSELQKLVDCKVKVYNNLAACQMKIEALDAAMKSCDAVLRIEAANVKALYRKGKVLGMKGSAEEAIPLLKKALALEPENKSANWPWYMAAAGAVAALSFVIYKVTHP